MDSLPPRSPKREKMKKSPKNKTTKSLKSLLNKNKNHQKNKIPSLWKIYWWLSISMIKMRRGWSRFKKLRKFLHKKASLLKNVFVSLASVDVHYKISIPMNQNFVTFDEFLFVFSLCEDESSDVENKYDLCKKADPRLVEFLR